MAKNTEHLGLYEKESTDGNDTFNIQTMLNENWDKIDADSKNKDTDIANNAQQFADLYNLINNLNTNDIEARREIINIELKLNEIKITSDTGSVVIFLNKTGAGFFDLFEDTSNIDTANSTASIVNTDAIFTGQQLLKFLTQNFDTFKNIELNLYDLERQSINVDADVNNSNTIEATVSPDSIAIGDKFYLNGEIYTVNNVQLVEG